MAHDDLERAARWHARLTDAPAGGSTQAEEAAFDAWLRTRASRGEAFAAVATADAVVRDLADEPALRALGEAALARTGSRRLRTPRWTIAAVVGGLVIVPVAALTVRHLSNPSQPSVPTVPSVQQTVFATGVGQQRLVTLDDGARILLDTSSRLTVRGSVLAVQGQAGITVGRQPIDLRLKDARVTIRSGSVNIRADADRVDLFAQSGHAVATLVRSTTQPVITAGGGDMISLSRGVARRAAAPDPEAVTGWQTGWLHFDDVTLAHAVRELNRYRRMPVTLVGDTASLRISGSFRTEDADAFLDAVATSLPVEVNRVSTSPTIVATAK